MTHIAHELFKLSCILTESTSHNAIMPFDHLLLTYLTNMQ